MVSVAELEHPLTAAGVRFGPGRRAVYKPNHRSFGAFMRSDQMRDVTARVATDIAIAAGALTGPAAPDEPEDLLARVKEGFKVKKNAGLMKVGGNLRVRVDVVNNVDGSALFEHGARQIARRRMLGRAGAKFGDFKPEGGPQ